MTTTPSFSPRPAHQAHALLNAGMSAAELRLRDALGALRHVAAWDADSDKDDRDAFDWACVAADTALTLPAGGPLVVAADLAASQWLAIAESHASRNWNDADQFLDLIKSVGRAARAQPSPATTERQPSGMVVIGMVVGSSMTTSLASLLKTIPEPAQVEHRLRSALQGLLQVSVWDPEGDADRVEYDRIVAEAEAVLALPSGSDAANRLRDLSEAQWLAIAESHAGLDWSDANRFLESITSVGRTARAVAAMPTGEALWFPNGRVNHPAVDRLGAEQRAARQAASDAFTLGRASAAAAAVQAHPSFQAAPPEDEPEPIEAPRG